MALRPMPCACAVLLQSTPSCKGAGRWELCCVCCAFAESAFFFLAAFLVIVQSAVLAQHLLLCHFNAIRGCLIEGIRRGSRGFRASDRPMPSQLAALKGSQDRLQPTCVAASSVGLLVQSLSASQPLQPLHGGWFVDHEPTLDCLLSVTALFSEPISPLIPLPLGAA